MLGFFKKHADKLRYYDAVTGMSKITRRYFVMNSFDGALTMFGLLLGSYSANVQDPLLIIHIGLGTSIAISFSGLTGAFMTERAERAREIRAMERALHRKLDNTDYKKAYEFASFITGVVDGASPLLAALVLLSPFLLFPLPDAYYMSFGLALGVFFFLGTYLGRISRESLVLNGLRFLGAGILCLIVILLVENMSSVV